MERGAALTRAYTVKEAALVRAVESLEGLKAEVETLATEKASQNQQAKDTIEELRAALRREKLERSVVEGALETGRKDFARVMREVMSLQRLQQAEEAQPELKAANAA